MTDKSINKLIGPDNVEKIKALFKTITKTSEFEFIFFSKKEKNLTLEKYIMLLRFFGKRPKDKIVKLVRDENTLDVSYSPDKDTTYRCTLSNKKAIDKYMQKLSGANNHVIFRNLVKLSQKDPDVQAMKKGKIDDNTIDIDDLYMRVRLSDELELTKEEINTLSKLDESAISKIILRYKERTSLYVLDNENGYVKVDLTITKMDTRYNRLNDALPRYELEIEAKAVKPDIKALDLMFAETQILFKVLQQSNFIITRSESEKVVNNYRGLLSVPESSTNALYGRQPVSLEIQYVEGLANKYAVTDKADGERHFLVIDTGHVYLINKNLDVKNTGIVVKEEFSGSVLDGELIFLKNRHVFLVFDCLFESGVDVRKESSLAVRLKHADAIIAKCFVLEGQKGYTPTSVIGLDAHRTQINKMFDALNYDIGIEKQFVLVRRKYFVHSLGAKPWEIYEYSSLIWRLYTVNSACPYILDGLIYQPNEQAYIVNKKDSKYEDFKWKPPEKNSIDFYIEFMKDASGNDKIVYDNSFGEVSDDPNSDNTGGTERIRNRNYKICRLFVGQSIGKGQGQIPVQFREQDGLNLAYILLRNGEARDSENNIITDKTVVEFCYNDDSPLTHEFKWIPLKTRYDKTEAVIRRKENYGNFITSAERVWKSIANPVLMSDFDDLAKGNNPEKGQFFYDKKIESIRKKIGHDLIVSAAKEDKYFQISDDLAKPMKSFHNFIKSNIIYTFAHSMYQENKQKSILDLGVGRGVDLNKFYYAKAAFLVGLDFDKDALTNPLRSATSIYERERRKPGFTKMFFIHGDFASELDYESQVKSLGGMDAQNRQLVEKYFSRDPKKRMVFDLINIQFAIHYAFKNDETFRNFKNNINNYLREDGFLLVSTFDGNSVRELLKGKENFLQEYTDDKGNVKTLFDIKKKYEDVDESVIMGTGKAIDVHMAWLWGENVYHEEYIVDDRFIVEEFKRDCGLELVTTDLFKNLLVLYEEYLTKYAKYEQDERTRGFLMKAAEIYKSNSVNDGSRVYTNLERYFVFRKATGAGAAKKEKTKKGGGSLTDTSKFAIEQMNGYDNSYSFMNSIHHLLRKHDMIPKTLSPERFYKDMGIKMVDDLEIDGKYKNVAKKIVIAHEKDDGAIEKVVNGLNVLICERDCNGEYDVDVIEAKKKIVDSDMAVVLIKEGSVYVPVVAVGPDGVKSGLFRMGDDAIKELQRES